MAALPSRGHARAHAAAFAELLADVTPAQVDCRAALAHLPVVRKHELLERQRAARGGLDVFGGFATVGWHPRGGARRVFASPGPIYEPEGHAPDYWRAARALYAAGFRAGDLVHNSFSYHLTPAGAMMETAALALDCTVFPGGVGNTELQLQAAADLQPHGYVGTPSFLRILLEKAADMDARLPSLRKALMSGEALPPSLRDWFAARGIAGFQCYATADIGLIAYETDAREGLVLDERIIVEIVRPGTGDPVADGEVGEVVVTTLNPDHPLIRFGTGDLSAVLPGPCAHGPHQHPHPRLASGADQTAPGRGRERFVHPAQSPTFPAPSRDPPGAPGGERRDGERPHDPAGGGGGASGGPRGAHRRDDPLRHQAARRGGPGRPRRAAQRRQGHRGRTPLRVSEH
jgi:phenylacetate-CoA ligase